MHACYHTLAYSLFFLSPCFPFLGFVTLLFPLFFLVLAPVMLFFWCCDDVMLWCCNVHGGGSLYTACRDWFLLFYPLTTFVWMWVSFQTTHLSVSCPVTTTYLCWPCHILLLDKEIYFVCLFTMALPFE